MSLKILHCIRNTDIGGIQRLVIELVIEQSRKGLDVALMLDERNGHYYQYLLDENIKIIDSRIKGGLDFNLKTYIYLKRIYSSYDIIHLHSFTFLISAASRSSKAKVIYTLHGLSKNIRKENFIKYFVRESFKRFYLNNANFVIANSKFTLSLAKTHYGLNNLMTSVILNGINLTNKKTLTNNIYSEIFTIGLVSRFTHRKRIERLISAFEIYKSHDYFGQLVILGDGETFDIISQKVNDSKYKSSIKLLGYKHNVEDYYNTFDICVFPSENEPFGLVALEAYLYGKPVISFSDSGGLLEVIEPLEPENIVENEIQLSNRLEFYDRIKDQIPKNRKKRIDYAIDNFSIERMYNDYYNIYNKLINY